MPIHRCRIQDEKGWAKGDTIDEKTGAVLVSRPGDYKSIGLVPNGTVCPYCLLVCGEV